MTACPSTQPPPPGTGIEDARGDPLFTSKICPADDWVGFFPPEASKSEDCPDARNWTKSSVRVGNELTFCRYRPPAGAPVTGPNAQLPDPRDLPSTTLKLERNCKIVGASAPVALLDPSIPEVNDMEQRITWHLGCPKSGAKGCGAFGLSERERQAFDASDKKETRAELLVLDSHVPLINNPNPNTPNDWLSRSMHGSSVVAAAERAGTPEFLTAPVVLPLIGNDGMRYDDDAGGQYGTLADLAAALTDFVNRWDVKPADKRTKVVINLSVGWSPEFGEHRQITQEILRLIIRARCAGALVVVAAGNRQGKNQEPVYPAIWADRILDKNSCPVSGGEPVVYAVGAVAMWGSMAGISRERAIPRIAAPAYAISTRTKGMSSMASAGGSVGALVPWASGEIGSTWLTGTSIAAAHVSGLAVRIWQENPGLSGKNVMDLIYDTGSPLRVGSERRVVSNQRVTLGQGKTVRTIHICRALLKLCKDHGCLHRSEIEKTNCSKFADPNYEDPKPSLRPLESIHLPTGTAPIGGTLGVIIPSSSSSGPPVPALLPQPGQVRCSVCRPRPGSVELTGLLLNDGGSYTSAYAKFTLWDYADNVLLVDSSINIGTEFLLEITNPEPFDLGKFAGGVVEIFDPVTFDLIGTDELLPPPEF